jgi:hypothetical protein
MLRQGGTGPEEIGASASKSKGHRALCVQPDSRRATSSRPEVTLQTLQDVPYGKWRDYDPEDTVRFYALRLHEIGMIRSSPHQITANGTDWRFLNEVKRELGI